MRTLSSVELLELWEKGSAMHPLDRGLMVLNAALLENASDRVADWPLGRRNRSLFELHRSCFGPHIRGWCSCAQCAEPMEFAIDVGDLMDGGQSTEQIVVFRNEVFRLPTSRDLAAVIEAGDASTAVMQLLRRCAISRDDASVWPDEDVEAISRALSDSDPMAETRVALRCPSCGYESDEVLDIAGFVWAEIESRAKRSLYEVHVLASAYGWTEAEVLSLSAARRASYLRMVQA
jgi:hypothetical protein